MKRRIPGGGLTVAVVVAAVLAACSGQGGDGHGSGGDGHRGGDGAGGKSAAPLSVAALRSLAADAEGTTCPVPYDVPAALRAADVHRQVERRSVEGELPDGPDSALARFKGALVGCGYRIGGERARLFTVGAGEGHAVNVLLPQIQHDARLEMAGLQRYAARTGKAAEGEPVLTPSGNVASVRLPVAGDGDLALVVTVGEGRTQLSRTEMTAFARHLAGQATRG
ncbi:hypothetical protein QLX52_02810 [Streptomyces albus]|uniref:hypothetical protein n=1 Tax=Streptomyces TaxID=1883 RepID=UPI001CEDADE0|nr:MULTISPECIES: hypothetical protein [Streptomyces]MDI6407781.1 hypothetical protein [Streptomyces albus]